VEMIRGAGKRPVERDSLYQTVKDSFDAAAGSLTTHDSRLTTVVAA